MQKIFWFPLAKHLAEYLKEQRDKLGDLIFDGVDIYAGTKDNHKKFPCVEITLDRESNATNTGSRGDVSLWIDIVSKNSSGNPADAYEEMYKYQTAILNLMRGWASATARELGIALKAEISDILSDGDIQRPTCASRMILNVEWRNCI